MATVPIYEQQVDAKPLPGFRQESVASPDLLGSAGDTQLKTGAGMLAAGTGMAAVAYHMQQKENLQKVQEATAQYTESVQKWQEEAQQKRTGAAAEKLVDDFGVFHQKTTAEIGRGLGNDAQRQAFENMARKTGLSARHDVATFQIAQTRIAGKQAHEATVATATNAMATAITDEAVRGYRETIINSERAYGAVNNLEPDVINAVIAARLTEAHAQRIKDLAMKNRGGEAAEYAKANEKEIVGPNRASILEFAEKTGAANEAVKAADNIWSTIGPEKGLDVMEKAMRDLYPNDEHKRNAGIASLRDRTAAYDKGQNTRLQDAAAPLNLAVSQGKMSVSQLTRDPTYIALTTTMGADGKKMAGSLVEHARNIAYTATVRATADEARQQQILQRRGFAKYLEYAMRPDLVAQMSPNEITNLLPVLGNELTGQLANMRGQLLKSPQKVIEARMDNEDFNLVAQQVGLRPFDTKKSEDEKAGLGILKQRIETKIDAWQITNGKQMPREEKMKMMRQEFDNKVLVDEFGRDPVKPVILLKDDERKNAYVLVNGEPFYLKNIPEDEHKQIVILRQRRGEKVTEELIVGDYLEAQRRRAVSSKVRQIPQ